MKKLIIKEQIKKLYEERMKEQEALKEQDYEAILNMIDNNQEEAA